MTHLTEWGHGFVAGALLGGPAWVLVGLGIAALVEWARE